MSSVIKLGSVVSLSSARMAQTSEVTEAPNIDENQTTELEARLALEKALADEQAKCADLQADVEAAFARGEVLGREEGRREAEDREAERLTSLQNAVEDGLGQLRGSLRAMHILAAQLASECLDKLFADPHHGVERVRALLNKQVAALNGEVILDVRVSAADFSDGALEELRAVLAAPDVTLTRDSNLGSGGCILKPRLGEIDISLDTQWPIIREALRCLPLPEDQL